MFKVDTKLFSRPPLGPKVLTKAITLLFLAFAVIASAGAGEIHKAVRTNDIMRVDAILEKCGPEVINSTITGGITPLHLAAALNHDALAALLISRGADLEIITSGGFTPLHWAASRDAVATARLLITLGVDINAEACKGITPLHWAASRNATNVIKLLIASGAHVQATTEDGFTPLHWALRNDADEAGVLLAYKTASEQMEMEEKSEVAAKEDLSDVDLAKSENQKLEVGQLAAGILHPEGAPHVLPRSAFGKSLIVPVGLGESLVFVWIEDLKIWAGKYEITNGQYRRFKRRHDSKFHEDFSLNRNDHPVVYVSWEQAKAFCDWLNKDYSDRLPLNCEFRLPTEDEWIVFAKCGDNRKYPWGNKWPPRYGNYSDLTARRNLSVWRGIRGYEDGFTVTCPVFESGVNEWGIYGLAGNVWEWCEDWYDSSRKFKVRHGGSWDFDQEPGIRVNARGFDRPEARYDTIGFRVVVSKKD